MQIPISIVIPVKNEEVHLPLCLEPLRRFSEVVVVDSSSVDRTKIIALDWGATYINFEWNGKFPKKRNWILDNYHFANDWILFLDADEIVNDAFVEALENAIQDTSHSGFWLTYTNYFLGKKLRFGVPQRKLAFFKRSAGRYERIEEEFWSDLDMEVHEHPIIVGSIGEIGAKIDHRDMRGLTSFLNKHIDYAKWESSRYTRLCESGVYTPDRLTGRQMFKYRNIGNIWFGNFYFLYTYLFRFGFLDGSAGYKYAYFKKWYFTVVRNLILENQDRKPG